MQTNSEVLLQGTYPAAIRTRPRLVRGRQTQQRSANAGAGALRLLVGETRRGMAAEELAWKVLAVVCLAAVVISFLLV